MRLDELLAVPDVRPEVFRWLGPLLLCKLRRVCRAFAFADGWATEALGRLRNLPRSEAPTVRHAWGLLRQCTGLTELDLSMGGGLLPSAGGLVGSPRRRPGATGDRVPILAGLIRNLPALRVLHAESSGLTDAELVAAAGVASCDGLEAAKLSENDVGDTGCDAVFFSFSVAQRWTTECLVIPSSSIV
eukprot:SAG31_NODE_5414_length_2550_cov_1.906977_1_plen_188_part_00